MALVLASWTGVAIARASTPNKWFASPTGSGTTCTAPLPCDLPTAIATAAPGDTVMLSSGTYSPGATVTVNKAIIVQGVGHAAIVAPASATYDAVSASTGAVLENLRIETDAAVASPAPGVAALVLDGATGQNLTVSASDTDAGAAAVVIHDTNAATASILRTALVTSASPGGSAISLTDGATPGGATILNVTAACTESCAASIASNMAGGSATVKNAIATGGPVTAQSGTGTVTLIGADYASASGPVAVDATDITAAPVFAGATDFHETAGSPTIRAGFADAAMTEEDLGGTSWASPPDMGAYQYTPPATTTTTGGPATGIPSQTGTTPSGNTIGATNGQGNGKGHLAHLAAPSAPVAGKSVTLKPDSGTVLVELPHTTTEIPLRRAAQLPVGAVVNAVRGSVTLTSAVSTTGATKTGTFHGGTFAVVQTRSAHPTTTLKLTGGSFAKACTVHSVLLSAATRAKRPSHKVVRQLWGSDHGGRFVTVGRGASAAVRGTVWLTQDRCDGTLVKVLKGKVLVHDDRRHRNVLVSAGHAYLAHVAS